MFNKKKKKEKYVELDPTVSQNIELLNKAKNIENVPPELPKIDRPKVKTVELLMELIALEGKKEIINELKAFVKLLEDKYIGDSK